MNINELIENMFHDIFIKGLEDYGAEYDANYENAAKKRAMGEVNDYLEGLIKYDPKVKKQVKDLITQSIIDTADPTLF